MSNYFRFAIVASVVSMLTLAADDPLAGMKSAHAQFGRRGGQGGSGGGGWRGMGGGGGGGDRGNGGGGGGGDWRNRNRDGEKSNDSKSGDSKAGGGSNGGSSGSSESKPASSASASMSNADFAKQFVAEHDKNKNKWLDGDELKDLHGKPADADLNKDGVITVEELTARLSSDTPAPSAAAPSTFSGGSSGGGGDSGHHHHDGDDRKGDADGPKRVYTGTVGGTVKEGDKRHSYRFSTAADKLPKDLPSFFSKDENGDGQISMSEYSHSWTKTTVAEFRKYDLNGDGVITAKEAKKGPSSSGG